MKKANDMKINDLGKSYIQKSIYEGFQKIFIKVIGIFLLGMLFYGFGKAIPR